MATALQAQQGRLHLDRRLTKLGPAGRFVAPRAGWLRAVREALGMSAAVLARRLGVSAQAVRAMEISELDGRIRIDTLRRAADAMDCELVYVVLPRTTLQNTVDRQAIAVARRQMYATDVTMSLEDQAVGVDGDAVRRQAAEIVAAGRQWRDDS